jgi:phage recombination protein Bet
VTGTAIVLPASSDSNTWSAEEKAIVEAAGLVHVDAQSGARTLADRPVVAAFMQHVRRTGLDPIARQIYCLARKSKGQLKWQIQISIDGARLVAERSRQYEGQTPVQWTADGVNWVDVWLGKDQPAAARVGVYRAGFREPLFAVATWDAYVQTDFKGNVTSMWAKMGPLMLGKCAEMLALRKAFPQDLSGLYSTEEMAQAEQPSPAVEAAAAPPESAPEPSGRDWLAEAKALASKEQINALWSEVPAHERSDELLSAMREIGIGLAQAEQEAWAKEQPATSEWKTAEIPTEEVRPGEEETPPQEGMESEPETGGGDRG